MKYNDIDVSIDRLTILADSESGKNKQSPYSLCRKLRVWLLEKMTDSNFRLVDYQGLAFGVEYLEYDEYDDEKKENLIFCHVFERGSDVDLRIDFNPNSLKKRKAEKIWAEFRYFLKLNHANVRLTRFDLAFDIYNAPEIKKMQNLKGGITRKQFYGRSGALETVYWGSQASSVQIRLYDKIAEIGANMSELEHIRSNTESLWRLEMQMRTKVIDDKLAEEVEKRLEDFSMTSAYALDLELELQRFADMFFNSPEDLDLAYKDVHERTIRRWKAKIRKVVAETRDDYVEIIKKALQRDSEKLKLELKKYCDTFLGF